MNDRELLELAAKAAGIELQRWRTVPHECFLLKPDFQEGVGVNWNPITEDGDALRLAVKLGLIVDVDIANCVTTVDYTAGEDFVLCEGHGIDANKATRRAITLAAAEIGKSMP